MTQIPTTSPLGEGQPHALQRFWHLKAQGHRRAWLARWPTSSHDPSAVTAAITSSFSFPAATATQYGQTDPCPAAGFPVRCVGMVFEFPISSSNWDCSDASTRLGVKETVRRLTLFLPCSGFVDATFSTAQ